VYSTKAAVQVLANAAFVFITVRAQPNVRIDFGRALDRFPAAAGLGAAGVIVKPFDPMKLPDEVRSLWNDFQWQNS
jgi:hypothetical protein